MCEPNLQISIGVEKIRYNHPPGFNKSVYITFIENGPVVFESLANKQTQYIHTLYYIYIYRSI